MASKHITLKLFSPLHPLFPGEPDYHFTIFHTINITLYTRVRIIFCSFLTFILLLLYTHFFHCKLTATISLQPHYLMSLLLYRGLPGGSDSKESACNAGDPVQSLGLEDPLEKGMAIHSSILAWRIPWTEESGRLWGCKESDMTD